MNTGLGPGLRRDDNRDVAGLGDIAAAGTLLSVRAPPSSTGESERSTPCRAESSRASSVIQARRRLTAAAAERRPMTAAVRRPWTRQALRARRCPSAVRAPVLLPPCRRQRPFFMAGWRQAEPARVVAPKRGPAR